MYEKTDKNGLYRDVNTGAVVNRDTEALKAYKLRKEQSRLVRENDKRISQIEQDISDIKNLLLQQASNNNNND
jgi:DNA-binding transcriptional regulator PaaX